MKSVAHINDEAAKIVKTIEEMPLLIQNCLNIINDIYVVNTNIEENLYFYLTNRKIQLEDYQREVLITALTLYCQLREKKDG